MAQLQLDRFLLDRIILQRLYHFNQCLQDSDTEQDTLLQLWCTHRRDDFRGGSLL